MVRQREDKIVGILPSLWHREKMQNTRKEHNRYLECNKDV